MDNALNFRQCVMRVAATTLLLGAVGGLCGCYEHVVSAKGVGASAYKVEESNLDNPAVVTDLRGKTRTGDNAERYKRSKDD